MKSWKNRRNTYWIFIATVFGLIFPSNQTNNYKNIIGLLLCWILYWFCFFYNNQEVEEQERREKEEHQKRVELELAKKERERIEKEKKAQQFYELIECPKIINYIMAKYNRDWEKDLYPKDAKSHLYAIKLRIQSEIEDKKRDIYNYKITIEQLNTLKQMHSSQYEKSKINSKIDGYQNCIIMCQEAIKNIPLKYKHRVDYYQNQIEQYKNQCREYVQKADELLLNSPEEIIKAIDYHLRKIEQIRRKLIENNNYNNNESWIKREEEKLPYLLQAKLDAIDSINRKKELI